MCGIMGVIGRRPNNNWAEWGQLTAHRGPDAFGLWSDEHALLGHNRLAIIDLSSAANQPMTTVDGDLAIVFNGEIFNFGELRDELAALGEHFTTHSDTEVLLRAYQRWGAEMLDRLDGMFALAIWDTRRRRLFAARDHAGIKPLFYRHDAGRLVFGSELKLLTALREEPLVVRPASVYEYLIYSYIPAPFTALEGYLKLQPGHWLEYDEARDHVEVVRWWSVPDRSLPTAAMTDPDAAGEELRRLFRRAVQRRMIADVPLGAFLSGGVDSSAIVAEMAAASTSVRTFSVGYRDNAEYDETPHAQTVARALGVDHTVLYPQVDDDALGEYLDLVVSHFDEPYGNPTVLLTFLLTAAAREHVTVSLVGDGGDELFAGYPRHRALQLAERSRWWAGALAPLALGLMRRVPETPSGNHRVRRGRRFLRSLARPAADAFQDWTSIFPADRLRPGILGEVFDGLRARYIGDWFERYQGDVVGAALYTDLNSFLPYNLLEGADRMSMANGFELRVPFVAREMIEFAATVPSTLKIRGATQKFLLKHAYRDVLPSEILERPKRGFNPPVWHWLQANEAFVRGRLTPADAGELSAFIAPEFVRGVVDEFFSRRADHSVQIWMLLVLERWLVSLPAGIPIGEEDSLAQRASCR